MTTGNTFQIGPRGDREIVMARTFDAPRALVYEAYTTPALVKRWLGVFGGWELAVCDMNVTEGGTYRWVWRNKEHGAEMAAGGVFREVSPPDRLVCTERFDDAWYAGEALNTITFVESNGKTTMTSTLRYESTAVRDSVLASPMETGVTKGYDALEEILRTARSSAAAPRCVSLDGGMATADGRYKIVRERTDSHDHFYTADYLWSVIELATGACLASFDESMVAAEMTGTRAVSFSDDELEIVISNHDGTVERRRIADLVIGR